MRETTWQIEEPHPLAGRTITLLTPAELAALPDGTEVVDIFGARAVKGVDGIDGDTRGGYLAYGLLQGLAGDPMRHAPAVDLPPLTGGEPYVGGVTTPDPATPAARPGAGGGALDADDTTPAAMTDADLLRRLRAGLAFSVPDAAEIRRIIYAVETRIALAAPPAPAPAGEADMAAAARISQAARALSGKAVELAQRYVVGQSAAVEDASAALLSAANALYSLPSADARRALLNDPILHAVYTRGMQDGMDRATAPAREDAGLLDEAERHAWLIEPQMGGGWVVSTAEEATDAGDADVVMLASTRGSLRDALRAARRAAGEVGHG